LEIEGRPSSSKHTYPPEDRNIFSMREAWTWLHYCCCCAWTTLPKASSIDIG